MVPVRRRWLMALTRELQLLAGDLAFAPEADRFARLHMARGRLPSPRGPVEQRLFDALFSEARLHCQATTPPVAPAESAAPVPAHATAARRMLETRYAESWTLQRLARTVGRSRSELAADFRQSFASSIHRFLSAQRMRAACHLLTGSDTKVEAIALTVGYRSKKSFYAEFRRAFGTTPSRFRKGSISH